MSERKKRVGALKASEAAHEAAQRNAMALRRAGAAALRRNALALRRAGAAESEAPRSAAARSEALRSEALRSASEAAQIIRKKKVSRKRGVFGTSRELQQQLRELHEYVLLISSFQVLTEFLNNLALLKEVLSVFDQELFLAP